jgi:hypothetical protein
MQDCATYLIEMCSSGAAQQFTIVRSYLYKLVLLHIKHTAHPSKKSIASPP